MFGSNIVVTWGRIMGVRKDEAGEMETMRGECHERA